MRAPLGLLVRQDSLPAYLGVYGPCRSASYSARVDVVLPELINSKARPLLFSDMQWFSCNTIQVGNMDQQDVRELIYYEIDLADIDPSSPHWSHPLSLWMPVDQLSEPASRRYGLEPYRRWALL